MRFCRFLLFSCDHAGKVSWKGTRLSLIEIFIYLSFQDQHNGLGVPVDNDDIQVDVQHKNNNQKQISIFQT